MSFEKCFFTYIYIIRNTNISEDLFQIFIYLENILNYIFCEYLQINKEKKSIFRTGFKNEILKEINRSRKYFPSIVLSFTVFITENIIKDFKMKALKIVTSIKEIIQTNFRYIFRYNI